MRDEAARFCHSDITEMGIKKIFIVPRWAGKPENDWYPWLLQHLNQTFPEVEVNVLNMPEPSTPTIENWVGQLQKSLPAPSEDILLIGHSVGNQAILRYLANIDSSVSGQYGAVLNVAGWFFVDKEKEWPTLLPWLTPFDTEKSKSRSKAFHLLISDNDRFTSDYKKNAATFEEKLGAHAMIVSGANHFNASEEPQVLQIIEKILH